MRQQIAIACQQRERAIRLDDIGGQPSGDVEVVGGAIAAPWVAVADDAVRVR